MNFEEIKMAVIGDLWLNNNTYKDDVELSDKFGPLFPGTENERHGKDWLVAKFKEYGLENVRAEEFRYMGWKRGDVCKLEILGHRSFCGRPMKVWTLPRSPSAPEGVEGEVIFLGSGTREDFERNEDKIPGKIVMAMSGGPIGRSIYRIEKYRLAKKMGAEGFIFMFGMEGDLLPTGTVLSNPAEDHADKPPAISITWEGGNYIRRLMEKGPVRVRITTNCEYVPNTPGWNIIGDVPGYSDEVVVIGAHWDGHDIGQGALDDTLGALSLLSIGRALAKHKGKFKRTLRIINFGLEELGCFGSRDYGEKHKGDMKNIVCMFECDGFARRGDAMLSTHNDEVLAFMKKVVKEEDIPIRISETFKGRPGNDSAAFFYEGVPVGRAGGTQEPGSRVSGRYPDHTAADTVDKMNVKRIRTSQMKFAHVLMCMLKEEKRFAQNVPKEQLLREIEEIGKAVEACRGKCVGYRPPFG